MKKIQFKEVYSDYGWSDKFYFKGYRDWRLQRKIEVFSNDVMREIDGELMDGSYFDKKIGLGKKQYKFNDDGIGVKK